MMHIFGLNLKGHYFNNPNPLGPTRKMTPHAMSPNKDKPMDGISIEVL